VLQCELYSFAPGGGQFTAAGQLTVRRYNFTTTLLASGRVLITGGYLPDSNTFSSAAEIYDQATFLTRRIRDLTVARCFHTATRLTNGTVLLTGGLSTHSTTDAAEIFDPASESFAPTLRMAFPRAYHSGNLLPDGRVLIAGGDSGTGAVAQAELYDPAMAKTPPAISIADVSGAEGDSGTNTLLFSVRLSAPVGLPVSVGYTTLPGSADTDDYYPVSGTLTFAPWTTNQIIGVALKADIVFEADETFLVQLFNPTNSVIANSEAKGTILNDDPAPEISVLPVSFPESNIRTTNFPIPLVLSRPSQLPVAVQYATVPLTAAPGADFIPTNGTLIFNGTTTQTVLVQVKGDILPEPDETFMLQLSNPTNGVLSTNQGVITILNDDGLPGVVD